ncbi:MAG: hypothetical protein ACC656_10345 [Candidatus Heimdallarchaeota archaeon]
MIKWNVATQNRGFELLSNYNPRNSHDYYVGSHNITITRNSVGELDIFYDSDLVIEATDNTQTISEKFLISPFDGGSSIDNISVRDITDCSILFQSLK